MSKLTKRARELGIDVDLIERYPEDQELLENLVREMWRLGKFDDRPVRVHVSNASNWGVTDPNKPPPKIYRGRRYTEDGLISRTPLSLDSVAIDLIYASTREITEDDVIAEALPRTADMSPIHYELTHSEIQGDILFMTDDSFQETVREQGSITPRWATDHQASILASTDRSTLESAVESAIDDEFSGSEGYDTNTIAWMSRLTFEEFADRSPVVSWRELNPEFPGPRRMRHVGPHYWLTDDQIRAHVPKVWDKVKSYIISIS